jgi:hypothetical protein
MSRLEKLTRSSSRMIRRNRQSSSSSLRARWFYLDKPINGTIAAYEDGFGALELSRKYYREAGLNLGRLDLRIR